MTTKETTTTMALGKHDHKGSTNTISDHDYERKTNNNDDGARKS